MKEAVANLVLSVLIAIPPAAARGETLRVPSRLTDRIDESKVVRLVGNTHPLARPDLDRGAAPDDLPMERMLLVLERSPEQEAALRKLIDAQLDPLAAQYHHWLTPDVFGQRFGPNDADIHTVTSWLASHGFQVARVSPGRTVIEFSGTAGQVRQAFRTTIHRFHVDDQDYWANGADPAIPAALAPLVAGVLSLHNFRKSPAVQPLMTYPSPCFASGARPDRNCYALSPSDFATIYDVAPLWSMGIDGTGQTIAIAASSNINVQNARDFRFLFNQPAHDPVVIVNGRDPGIVSNPSSPEDVEAILDVEWTGAVAPGATIALVVSATTNSTFGGDLSSEYVVSHNTAPILSISYGACEPALGSAGNRFYNLLWQQAAAEGITVLVSTGDAGSAHCDNIRATTPSPATHGLAVSGIASTPYDVAVGGTSFDDLTQPSTYWNSANDPATKSSALSYVPETTWNDTCSNALLGRSAESVCNDPPFSGWVKIIAGSGGRSTVYPKPPWQAGPGVASDGARDIPDVSLFGGGLLTGHFYLFCQRASDNVPCDLNFPNPHIGLNAGTSISVQAFAGITALLLQRTNGRQGNIAPTLYKLAAEQSGIFHDVTSGTIAVPCARGSANCVTGNPANRYGVLAGYDAGPGYDLATGLGSVDAFNLVNSSAWIPPRRRAVVAWIAHLIGIGSGSSGDDHVIRFRSR